MQYILLIYDDPSVWAKVPQEEAKVVRVRGGKPFVTDGPFAETKEIVAGFDLLECDSDEEAQAIAAAHPVARFGAIEVRRFASRRD